MNICLLTSTSLPLIGGLEVVVHNLAIALTNLGHRVYLVTPILHNRKVVDNYSYRVIRFGFKGYGRLRLVSASAILTLLYVVKRFKIDVINIHNVYTPGSWAYYFCRYLKKMPIIGTPHGDDIQTTQEIKFGIRLNPESDRIVRRNLGACSMITSISQSVYKELQNMGINNNKLILIPNGVWTQNFQIGIDKLDLKKKLGIPQHSVVLISIGRNHPVKGYEYSLDAVAKLRNGGANVSYILVGRNMSPIIEKARSMGISNCLITPGEVNSEKISEFLQASDIFISSSLVESFGLTTLEAMCSGLPCIVTNIAGSRDLVSSEFGIFYEAGNSGQLTDAIKCLITNPSLREIMGSKAHVEAMKYNWETVAKKYEDVYRKAILYN